MRHSLYCVLAVCLMTLLSPPVWSFPAESDPGTAADTLQQIVAHRGASSDRPENTLSALQRAIELKATAVEIDVRTSKDGTLFLLHDAKLDRTTDGTGSGRAVGVSHDIGEVDGAAIGAAAAQKAEMSAKPSESKPGDYTVVLEPVACEYLLYNLTQHLESALRDGLVVVVETHRGQRGGVPFVR